MNHGTQVTDRDGRVIRKSRNLRGMLDYCRTSRPYRIHAQPDPANPYNGLLRVEYENGAHSMAHFACYTVLLEWLFDRRTWRRAPFWTIEQPAPHLVSWRTADAWRSLNSKGLTCTRELAITYGPKPGDEWVNPWPGGKA